MNKRQLLLATSPWKKQKIPFWLKHLRDHGYAIVPNLIDEEKVLQYSADFWAWMEGFGTGIDRSKPRTWNEHKWPPTTRGIIQQYGIGHAKFIWKMRTEPEILEIFSTLWETEDLLVSFDGACLSVPYKKPPAENRQSWAHIDQGPKRGGRFECVQGLITLSEAGPGLGGLVVYADSHKLNKKFYKTHETFAKSLKKGDWCKLSEEHRQWFFDNGAKEIQLQAPPGSLLLWDSRTVHWAARPTNTSVPRMAVYVCYVPRSHVIPKELERKRKAFEDRRTTNHWPAQPRVFPKTPRTYGKPDPRFGQQPTLEETDVTPKIRSLAGF